MYFCPNNWGAKSSGVSYARDLSNLFPCPENALMDRFFACFHRAGVVRVEVETHWSGWPSSTRSTTKSAKKRKSSEPNVSLAELLAECDWQYR